MLVSLLALSLMLEVASGALAAPTQSYSAAPPGWAYINVYENTAGEAPCNASIGTSVPILTAGESSRQQILPSSSTFFLTIFSVLYPQVLRRIHVMIWERICLRSSLATLMLLRQPLSSLTPRAACPLMLGIRYIFLVIYEYDHLPEQMLSQSLGCI